MTYLKNKTMENLETTIPLKDIPTPTLLGYVAELQKIVVRNEVDLQYRKDLKAELIARGTAESWGIFNNLLTGPTN
jgi:hypothetical protein